MTAAETFAPTGLSEDTRRRLGDREPEAAWDAHDDGRWMVSIAARMGLERPTLARILADFAPSQALSDWRASANSDKARHAARATRSAAVAARTGAQRRALYARYAALCACVMGDSNAGPYAHAALAYSGADAARAADAVRAEVPWETVQALIDSGGIERATRETAAGDPRQLPRKRSP